MKTATSLATVVVTAAAHGMVTSPPARVVGDAFKAACGQQVYNNVQGDPYGSVQQLQQIGISQSNFNATACDLSLCKGLQLADSTSPPSSNSGFSSSASAGGHVQRFARGQVVAMTVDIRAPHTGVANVSVVDLRTKTVLGAPLMAWDVYASNAAGVARNNTAFSITMPDVAAACGTAGDCAVQWWWDSPDQKQTFMSCVDFTM